MAISGITAVPTAPRHAPSGSGRAVFAAAERYLGMTSTDLRAALGSGKTMASLATARGLSTEGLISAISSAVSASKPGVDPARATEIATRFAGSVPPAARAGRGPGGAGAPGLGRGQGLLMSLNGAARGGATPRAIGGEAVTRATEAGEPAEAGEASETDETGVAGEVPDADDAGAGSTTDAASRVTASVDPRANLYQRIASLLGVDTDSLRSALSHGVTVGELASARGVDRSQVASTIESSLRAGGQGAVSSRSGELADLLLGSSLSSGSLFSRSA